MNSNILTAMNFQIPILKITAAINIGHIVWRCFCHTSMEHIHYFGSAYELTLGLVNSRSPK